jgi:hypothetical protein
MAVNFIGRGNEYPEKTTEKKIFRNQPTRNKNCLLTLVEEHYKNNSKSYRTI